MTMNEYLTKYPWLKGYDPYPENDGDQCSLEWIPQGWVKAFGETMCEDIDRVIKENGLENEFRIDEMKEKYGGLRVYYGPCTPEIDNVVNTYELISESVCSHCGSIEGVKVVPFGWTLPLCRTCYGKLHRTTDFSKFDALPDTELPNVLKYTRYSKNGTDHFEMDISEAVQKIRSRYEQCKSNGEFENNNFSEWEENYYGA